MQAARDALEAELGSHPDFARGRQVEGNANRLLGALDDGRTALRSGSNAIHPADFADRFGARSPAGQSAERLAMRADLDATLRQRVGDVEALRNKLQGEDGFNAAKIGTAFGEEAPNRLQAAVDRERAFSDSESKVVHGAKSAPSMLSAERLKGSQPGSLEPVGRDLVRRWPADRQVDLPQSDHQGLVTSDNAPRDLEIARALIAQGSSRDQVLSALARVEARQAGVSRTANKLAAATRGVIAGAAPSSRPLFDPATGRNQLAGYMRKGAEMVGAGAGAGR